MTEKESEELVEWLKEPKNQIRFQQYIRADYYLNLNRVHQVDSTADSFEQIREELQSPRTKVRRLLPISISLVAASLALLLTLAGGYFILKETKAEEPVQVVDSVIEHGSDRATLTLDNGEQVELEKGSSYATTYANSDGEEIIYGEQGKQKELTYNYLTIPRGGQFALTLSDGTKVWLNSDSKLKYPIGFIPGQIRQVELLYGEAYFDVSPSYKNDAMGFQVIHNQHYIDVLGTQFNIKAYSDEQDIVTTLVEGKVTVHYQGEILTLLPDQQSTVNLNSHSLSIATVDSQSETAWRNGLFTFRDKTLSQIMVVMERWYNMDIEIENKDLENIKFKGTLNKDQSLREILDLIRNTKYINEYEINGQKVSIK